MPAPGSPYHAARTGNRSGTSARRPSSARSRTCWPAGRPVPRPRSAAAGGAECSGLPRLAAEPPPPRLGPARAAQRRQGCGRIHGRDGRPGAVGRACGACLADRATGRLSGDLQLRSRHRGSISVANTPWQEAKVPAGGRLRSPPVAQDQNGAGSMMHAVLADRAKKHSGEPAVAPAADHEQVGTLGRAHPARPRRAHRPPRARSPRRARCR